MASFDETNGWIFTDAAHRWIDKRFNAWRPGRFFMPEGFFDIKDQDDYESTLLPLDDTWWHDAARYIPHGRDRGKRQS